MREDEMNEYQRKWLAKLQKFEVPPEPAKPAEVKRLGGTPYRWMCRGCQTLCIGEPSRTYGRTWYCPDC